MAEPSVTVIFGTGRSGSTLFHELMAYHPSASWFSLWSDRNRHGIRRARQALSVVNWPLVGPRFMKRYPPTEPYDFWDTLYRGFSTPCRDLTAEDVSNDVLRKIRETILQLPSANRPHLLLKITGWPRTGFLQKIFPEARFIHVIRDGRAVASSLLKVDWWWGWRGPSVWRWGELSPEHRSEWERSGKSFVALAGIQWKILMDAAEVAKTQLDPAKLWEFKYETLCQDPLGHVKSACAFAGLPWDPRVAAAIGKVPVRSENEKWRRDLTPSQQETLESVLGTHLTRYGYPLASDLRKGSPPAGNGK